MVLHLWWWVPYVFVVAGVFGVKVLGDLAAGHAIEGIHFDVLAVVQPVRVAILECEVIVQVVVGQKP